MSLLFTDKTRAVCFSALPKQYRAFTLFFHHIFVGWIKIRLFTLRHCYVPVNCEGVKGNSLFSGCDVNYGRTMCVLLSSRATNQRREQVSLQIYLWNIVKDHLILPPRIKLYSRYKKVQWLGKHLLPVYSDLFFLDTCCGTFNYSVGQKYVEIKNNLYFYPQRNETTENVK